MKNIEENESKHLLHLTSRFVLAIDYARQVHANYRKGTNVPYIAHLLGVASLVIGESDHVPFRVTEDIVIAALLHDAVEDAGGIPRLRDIDANFGKEVARIVEGCTDSFEEDSNKKQEWEFRKKQTSAAKARHSNRKHWPARISSRPRKRAGGGIRSANRSPESTAPC